MTAPSSSVGRPRRTGRGRPAGRPTRTLPSPSQSRSAACAPSARCVRAASISRSSSASSSRPSRAMICQPRRSSRCTDWRSLRTERPSSVNEAGSTTASSPTHSIAQPEPPVAVQVAAGGGPQRHAPASRARELQELGEQLRDRVVGADRVSRHDRGLADQPVCEHGSGSEPEGLVGPQDERRDRVVARGVRRSRERR